MGRRRLRANPLSAREQTTARSNSGALARSAHRAPQVRGLRTNQHCRIDLTATALGVRGGRKGSPSLQECVPVVKTALKFVHAVLILLRSYRICAMRSLAFFSRLPNCLAAALSCVGLGVQAATNELPLVALVIGNSAYKQSPLVNPINDARDMAGKLRALGFTVIEKRDLATKQIGATLREFKSRLTPGAVALFFYAGHGFQVKGVNYLPVVDAEIVGEEDVPSQSISLHQVLEVMEDAKTRLNLVFLDACRDNPFARSFRSAASGLAKVSAPSGTLISFATRPGSVASDGRGSNGLYTRHLLSQMERPGVAIEQALKRVVSGVKRDSSGGQEPWMEGSIEGDFCFGGCGAAPLPDGAGTGDLVAAEIAFWNSIKGSRSAADYEAYLEQYPQGRFAALAKVRLIQPSQPEQPPAAPAASVTQAGGESPPAKPDSSAMAVPPAATTSKSASGCPGCSCGDMQVRLSMGVEPLTDAQRSFYRQSCR